MTFERSVQRYVVFCGISCAFGSLGRDGKLEEKTIVDEGLAYDAVNVFVDIFARGDTV